MSSDPNKQEQPDAAKRVEAIRDLSDFCNNWPKIRPVLVDAGFGQPQPNAPIQAAISWLVILADHVYRNDDI